MGVVGFAFTKFDGEKKGGGREGNVELNMNIGIKSVEKTSMKMGGEEKEVLKIPFNYDLVYGSELGKISIEGEILYTDANQVLDEIVKEWEANSRLSRSINERIHKFIYNKSIVKAMDLSDSLGLPLPLPKMNFSKGKSGQ